MIKIPHMVMIRGRYYCRIRWPKDVWKTLGDGAFKAALGTSDPQVAKQRMPAAMQEFQNKVHHTRTRQELEGPRKLGDGEITLMVAEWVRASKVFFKTNANPRVLNAQTRMERERFIQQRRTELEGKRKAMAAGDYLALYPILDLLLERHGLNPDRDDESFGILCRTLMRAWMALDETALAEMEGGVWS